MIWRKLRGVIFTWAQILCVWTVLQCWIIYQLQHIRLYSRCQVMFPNMILLFQLPSKQYYTSFRYCEFQILKTSMSYCMRQFGTVSLIPRAQIPSNLCPALPTPGVPGPGMPGWAGYFPLMWVEGGMGSQNWEKVLLLLLDLHLLLDPWGKLGLCCW